MLAASDELGQVFEKYTAVIVRGESVKPKSESNVGPYLLDLSSPIENIPLENGGMNTTYNATTTNHQSDMEALGDIFNSLGKSENSETISVSSTNLLIPDSAIMQPISISHTSKKGP